MRVLVWKDPWINCVSLCLPQSRRQVRRLARRAAAPFRGAWRRGWRWNIQEEYQPWTAKPAGSPPMAAWTATALRGSTYTRTHTENLSTNLLTCVTRRAQAQFLKTGRCEWRSAILSYNIIFTVSKHLMFDFSSSTIKFCIFLDFSNMIWKAWNFLSRISMSAVQWHRWLFPHVFRFCILPFLIFCTDCPSALLSFP